MKRCIICGQKLTEENNSREHIVPKRIGGIHPHKDIICKTCNNLMGSVIDKPFLNKFQHMYDMFGNKSSRVIMTLEQNNELYQVPFSNGQIDNGKMIKLIKRFPRKANKSKSSYKFNISFLSIKDYENWKLEIEERANKKGGVYHLEDIHFSKIKAPQFTLNLKFDPILFVMEMLKIQVEYLAYMGVDVKNYIGTLMIRLILNHPHDKYTLEILEEPCNNIFDNIVVPAINFKPKNITNLKKETSISVIPIYSKTKLINLFFDRSKTAGMFFYVSLFAAMNVWIPLMNFSNLSNLFGPSFINLIPWGKENFQKLQAKS